MISKTLIFIGLFVLLGFSNVPVEAFTDFDNDKKSDFCVFRPTDRQWYMYLTESQTYKAVQWGLESDRLVPADYDGDGRTDIAVWRPSNGYWYILRSRDNLFTAVQWGMKPVSQPPIISFLSSDEPVAGDYDGDGAADLAVWRPDTGVWYILKSSSGFNPNNPQIFQWGKLGDVPVPADYDGDRKIDYAVFRENRWYIFRSSDKKLQVSTFGSAGGDLLVPADYTGDGKADVAVYRQSNGTWYIERSQDAALETHQLGLRTDKPVPADYDGDGKTDVAVFRSGTWFIKQSLNGQIKVFNYGAAGDIPINSLNVRESLVAIP